MISNHYAWIEVDLTQFKKNIDLIRKQVPDKKICLPVKADAYNHGLIPISTAATEAGVDYLAVDRLHEAVCLREAGIEIPILILGAIDENQIPELLNYDLEFTISSLSKAKLVAEKCLEYQKKCRVHVEIETGLKRTGALPRSAADILSFLYGSKSFEIVGIYTHFANADVPASRETHKQINIFKDFIYKHAKNDNSKIICHAANSGAMIHYPESNFDMVRPGLLAYGQLSHRLFPTAPIFGVKSKIGFLKTVKAGEGIGFSHTYHAPQDARIATIPIGFADGYRSDLANKGEVLIRGKRFPVVGKICMSQLMVNIANENFDINQQVTLVGNEKRDEITLQTLASLCNLNPYEFLCGFKGLPRVYF